jgi:predicted ABC-type ATPase
LEDIFILGGPNGAGKTTAAKELLPHTLNVTAFVNADEIAREMSPSDVDRAALAAGRAMISTMQDLAQRGETFAFETTCAGRSHIGFLNDRKKEGWRINLLFLWLPSVDIALQRVAQRVREGGHAIPPAVIRRRYVSGLRNMLGQYLPLADIAAIYENADRNVF